MNKVRSTWRSERLGRDITVVRWGSHGRPVLLFPTAGGDAEEIERMLLCEALAPLIDDGRVKLYSCDSVAGRAMLEREGDARHRMRLLNMFQQCVRHEVAAAIRADCQTADIEIVAAGASIGALHALAVVCRWPNVFSRALAVSGTYRLERFLFEGPVREDELSEDFFVSSPHRFVPTLAGPHLDALRGRFVLLASGEGRAEDIGESWHMAHVLGQMGIPNRVEPWGPEWHHDWPTWRKMFPQYLGEWCR